MRTLLIPYINAPRKSRNAPHVPESHFYELEVPRMASPTAHNSTKLGEELSSLVRRLRHMYQVGLLRVLQDKGTVPALSMMARAMERLETASAGYAMGELWTVCHALLETAAEKRLHVNKIG